MKKNYFMRFLEFLSCKNAIASVLFLFAISVNAQSQEKVLPTEVTVLADSNIGKIDLQFKNDRMVENLLVIITDNSGQTVFLENVYRFKGLYKKTIDLKENGKGSYNLKIIKDEEKINKKIDIQ